MSRQCFLRVLVAAVIAVLASAPVYAGDLTVQVSSVRSDKGSVRIAVYRQEAGWPDREPRLAAAVIPAHPGMTAVVFRNFPSGPCAVAAFHDENNNGVMDRNFVWIPTEGYAFSGGKDDFAGARVDVPPAGLEITVPLVYE